MATETIVLDFYIHLRDADRVRALTVDPPAPSYAATPPATRGISRAPDEAAIEFAGDNGDVPLPLIGPGDPTPLPVGVGPGFALGCYLSSEWFPTTAGGGASTFPTDVGFWSRKSGGWFGLPFLFGDTQHYRWRGFFVYDPPLTNLAGDGVTIRQPVMKRRWIDPGPGNMFGNNTDTGIAEMSRDAGAHVDTFGFAHREQIASREHLMTEYMAGVANQVRCSWERLYLRLRKTGGTTRIWSAHGSAAADMIALAFLPTGQIALYNTNALTLIGSTTPLEVDRYYKVDIAFRFGAGGGSFAPADFTSGGAYPGAGFELFLDGVSALSFTPGGTGLGANSFHLSSRIGPQGAGETTEYDIGFWMNAQHPIVYNGIDFLNGSRAVLLRGETFAAGHANWTGDVRVLAQIPVPNQETVPYDATELTSSTALAELQIVTDAERALAVPGSIGVVGMVVCHWGHAGTFDGQFGYKLGAAARVLVQMGAAGISTEQLAARGSRMMYQPVPGDFPIDPADLVPIELHRLKGNDAALSRTYHLTAVAELIGVFAESDYDPQLDLDLRYPIPARGCHNAPYLSSPWAQTTAPPYAPVIIHSGTYVGNGTGQDLTFRAPVHWLWIRKVTGAGNPTAARWWSSMLGVALGGTKVPSSFAIPQIDVDPTFVPSGVEDTQGFQARVRLAGAHLEINRSGDTYAYIAVCDPASRFLLCGALAHSDEFLPLTNTLPIPSFTPIAAMLLDQRWGNYTVNEMLFKGPGHAVNAVNKMNGSSTALADGITFGAGTIALRAGFNALQYKQVPYAAMRIDDGSGDPGIVKVFGFGSYVGNGVATRDIVVVPLSGVRPLWILVVPGNTAQPGFYKDCSMPATEALNVDSGVVSTTAITGAAVNQFTVGAALNTNAITYHYMVIWGGTVAGLGGMSACGEFVPVSPDYGPCLALEGFALGEGCLPGDIEAAEAPGGDDGGAGDTPGVVGGGADDIETDLATACVPFTLRVFNDALSRIGVSQRIANAATENSEPADLCRQHYARAIETTLRDFPWPFATRYAVLTLLGGSSAAPINRDWTYSYRQPIDCVFERRLAVVREGAVDATPPPFQLSTDATGGRLFTNQADAQLEYTARPSCTAGVGDPLFIDALTWRLAAQIAGPLTRIADVMKLCLDKYAEKIANAYEVVRPGNPGPRTAIDALALDPGTGALGANIAVVNRALLRIGAQTVANLSTEQSRSAEAARLIFEDELGSTLREYPWPFATRYAALPWVAGTATVPVNTDWLYAYRLPADSVNVRRIATAAWGRSRSERDPEAFRVGSDAVGPVLYTRVASTAAAPLTIEYTARIANCVLNSDAVFRDAFAWRLAASLAPSLATTDPQATEQLGRGPEERPKERKATEAQLRERATTFAWRQYYATIEKARIAAANEAQGDSRDADADWIRGRE